MLPPARAYVWFAALCLAGCLVVSSMRRPGAPSGDTAFVLGAQAVLCVLLARLERVPPRGVVVLVRLVALAAIGLLAAWPGYFFGPNGAFAALILIVLCLVGVLGGGEGGRAAGWVVYVSLATGQAVVFALVATRALPDVSLAPVIVGTHPMSHHAAAHVFVQALYLAAFVSGRAANRRYRAVAVELEVATRAEMLHAALLEEARADYRRALRIGRDRLIARAVAVAEGTPVAARVDPPVHLPAAPGDTELDAPPTVATADWVGEDAAIERVFGGAASSGASRAPSGGSPSPSPSPATTAKPNAWLDASNYRMRRVLVLTLALCIGGAVLLGVIAVHPGPLYVAWGCIAGIAAAVCVHNLVVLRRGHAGGHWPWTVAGVLTVGPCFSTGLHSGFAALIAAPLFLGGLFRATDRAAWGTDRRLRIWLGIAVAHGTAFALVFLGVLPDLGNVPILVAGVPSWQIVAQQVLVQGVYFTAFASGVTVDRRYEVLTEQARAATERGARAQATLLAATAEIDRLVGTEAEAIFLGQHVGNYHLRRLIGRGGMGDVYEGEDTRTGGRVAVKLVRRERAADPTALRVFAQEASALARVRSPHVAGVLEAGGLEGELPYLAMELIEGQPLWDILKRRGPLPLDEVRWLVHDVASGLDDVHRAGVVHRDVKPQNIVLTGSGERPGWKLVDFGVAQIQDLMGGLRGMIVGTVQYMSPEQARGKSVDVRADLYSFSAVIYRAITGRPAFVGELESIARPTRRFDSADPRVFVSLPHDVELALRIGLSLDPEDRFASATELRDAFAAAFDGRLDLRFRRRGEELLAAEPWAVPRAR